LKLDVTVANTERFSSSSRTKKEQQHLRCQQPPSKGPGNQQVIFELRMKISNVLKARPVGERYEAGKAERRLINLADCCPIGENDGSASQIIGAHELEDIELFLGHNARKWAPM